MSDTQDTLIERLNRGALAYMSDSGPVYAGPTALEREAAAEIEALEEECRLSMGVIAFERARAEAAEAEAAALREHSHQRGEDIRKLSAEAAALRERLERAEQTVAFVARWAWRTDPPNANRKMPDRDRLSCIKHHPVIKKAAAPHIELAEHEASALNSGASQNG